jgi:hypothetical protein
MPQKLEDQQMGQGAEPEVAGEAEENGGGQDTAPDAGPGRIPSPRAQASSRPPPDPKGHPGHRKGIRDPCRP